MRVWRCSVRLRRRPVSDGSGVEYAVVGDAEGRGQAHANEGLMSLAAFLGVPLSRLLEMPAEERRGLIERRNAVRDPAVAVRYVERRLASP